MHTQHCQLGQCYSQLGQCYSVTQPVRPVLHSQLGQCYTVLHSQLDRCYAPEHRLSKRQNTGYEHKTVARKLRDKEVGFCHRFKIEEEIKTNHIHKFPTPYFTVQLNFNVAKA